MSLKFFIGQRGFTLAELLVASTITMLVLGGAVALTSQVQIGYRRQVEDSAAEQEGRYALDWVSRLLRSAGNNPYSISSTIVGECPPGPDPPPSALIGIIFDPNGDTINNDVRIQTDSNPPDGVLGGNTAAGCNQPNEDVTVSFDQGTNSITFRDNNIGGTATVRTDAVIEDLKFVFRNAARQETAINANVVYVETQVTIRTRTIDVATGVPMTRVLKQEVRIRGRHF